jgi:CYTH domain-containing protein
VTPAWQKHKYSLLEREKKFLLASLPAALSLETARVIEDIYFPDTRLRLRKMTTIAGETLELKLTQKFVGQDNKSDERVITNLYLNENEYALFSKWSGHHLKKRRYSYHFEHQHFAIDIFEGHLSGLVLAELEFSEQTVAPKLPAFAIREVTEEAFFTGGHLAILNQDMFRAGLERYL